MRFTLSLLWLTLGTEPFLCAQEFVIKRMELANQQVIVHYDLLDTMKNRSYTINVYASNDNFVNPLQKITGDVGPEIKPGLNKKMIWDPKAELSKGFRGGVSLEIRGKLYIPFIHLTGFDDYKSIKRLKPVPVTWTGGAEGTVLNMDVYQDDKKITSFPNISNVGHYNMTLPKSVKPGKNYYLRISDSKDKDEVINSGQFEVKRKVPLALKMLPLLAVGSAIIFIKPENNSASEIPLPIVPK
jgi:hypothetical protein